ncbi:MAG: RdgB/HAM1 family non-canonical purine NTP pyrophosphatase [Terriglobia bacterium]
MGPSVKTKLLVATTNKGKIREIREALNLPYLELVTPDDLPSFPRVTEHGASFKENAVIKAKTVSRWSGLPAVADDSGLEVDFLGGAPGIRSARYAGEGATDSDNNAKLLKALERVRENNRAARFVCVACYADPNGHIIVTEGELKGCISERPSGKHGFGYDPLFVPRGGRQTVAELGPQAKNRISHRAHAFAAMAKRLDMLLGPDGG